MNFWVNLKKLEILITNASFYGYLDLKFEKPEWTRNPGNTEYSINHKKIAVMWLLLQKIIYRYYLKKKWFKGILIFYSPPQRVQIWDKLSECLKIQDITKMCILHGGG